MGQVCPTSQFGKWTPINKGRNGGHTLENSYFLTRTGKDGVGWLPPFPAGTNPDLILS
jgi:hypothetical protein